MFSDKKKDRSPIEGVSSQNHIAQGTKLVGDITSESDFRIDGTIEGTIITTGKLAVGKSGSIIGTLQGTDAYFEGKFSGKMTLTGTLTLKSNAHIEGDVVVGKLSIESGANFNVNCDMKGDVKALNIHGKATKKVEQTA